MIGAAHELSDRRRMVMLASRDFHGTPMATAITVFLCSKQFLAPSKLRKDRSPAPSRRVKKIGASAKLIGGYLDPTVADREKEEAMEYRRMVFDHDDWLRHRSSIRHGRHLASIVSSRVILALGVPVFSLTGVAAVVTSYKEAISAQTLPQWLPLLHISSLPFSLTAPALALLLVFRTNASYARFDEARKVWGMNVNRSRDVCRQALTFMGSPADGSKLQSFLHYVATFPYTLKSHVSQGANLEEELVGLLEESACIPSGGPSSTDLRVANHVGACI